MVTKLFFKYCSRFYFISKSLLYIWNCSTLHTIRYKNINLQSCHKVVPLEMHIKLEANIAYVARLWISHRQNIKLTLWVCVWNYYSTCITLTQVHSILHVCLIELDILKLIKVSMKTSLRIAHTYSLICLALL